MAVGARRAGPRRPRWIRIGLLLSLVVLTVNAAVSAGSKGPAPRLVALSYLDQVRPQIERSTEQGIVLAQMRERAAELGREGVRRRLAQLRTEAEDLLASVRRTEPPETLSTAHSLLVAAMAVRVRAVTDLDRAVDQALGGSSSPRSVRDVLSDVSDAIVAADQTYRVFLDSLPHPGRLRSPPMPASRWADESNLWSAPELGALVSAIRSGVTDEVVHDVSVVVVRTDPAAVASEAGAAVLPLVRALRVEVVVANTGNQRERQVPVIATLDSPGGGADSARDFVDLAPGQRRVVTLAGLRPAPGPPSNLSVVIGPVQGEGAIADNGFAMAVVYRG